MSHRLLIVFACLIASTSSVAQSASPMLTVETVRAMDTNRDGRLTREEFVRVSGDDRKFSRLDKDDNGVLDASEIRASVRVRARILN